jgi:plastocyanin
MRRGMLLCVIVGAATVVLGMPGAALAGAGCHTGATQADESGEKEATVRMIDRCFTASVTKVDPGIPVTFVHEDPKTVHNVGGTEWGYYGEMTKGDVFTATFDDPGIYPFACSYHPGMTGAVVVGDGIGAGTGWTVSVDPFEPATTAVTRGVTKDEGLPAGLLVAVGVLCLALGGGIAFGIGRIGRTRTAA